MTILAFTLGLCVGVFLGIAILSLVQWGRE